MGSYVAAGVLSVTATGGLAAEAVGQEPAQPPQKARKTPRSGTATVQGVLQAPPDGTATSEGGVVVVSLKDGRTIHRLAVRVEGAADAPATVATHYGESISDAALRAALADPGRTMRAVCAVELLPGTDARLATAIEIGDPPKKGSPAPGLRYEDVVVGLGAAAERGDLLRVHYTGWLKGGEQFDSSRDRGEPLEFRLGSGKVIRGWDLGIAGMREGGKRTLTIGPGLAYGSQGSGGRVPPNATLTFEIELLKVE